MENYVKSLQSILTSLKPKTIRNLVVMVIGISIALLFGIALDSCSVKHIRILNDIEQYQKTLDPEFCETIVFQIDSFNDECEAEIEIMDCG